MQCRVKIAVLIAVAAGILAYGCGKDSSSSSSGDMMAVEVVVLRNGTNYRLPDAYIVVDGNIDKACYTAGPGDTEGGDCDFVLSKGEHRFVITKPSYQTLDTIYRITSLTSTVYFGLYTF